MAAREIPVDDATRVLAEGGIVLDVREAGEVAGGTVPGALHIPLGELSERIDEIERGPLVACLCRSGNRSAIAADYLASHGFDAVNLAGGMIAWTGELGTPTDRNQR